MSHFTHACRPLTAVTLLVGLCLTGGGAAFADTGESTPSTPTAQTRTANRQWAIDLDHGPDAGGTTVALTPPETGQFTQVDAAGYHTMALGSDGNLYTWGYGYYGQLGRDNTTGRTDRPGMVTKPAGVDKWTQISAGENNSMALGSDGNLYTWGRNNAGQLGRDTGDASKDATPGMVTKPAGVDKWTQISQGRDYSLAIGSDGNLYTWGDAFYNQLGRDTGGADHDATPGMVTKPNDIDKWTQISAGAYHNVAIGSDGNLYTWGSNTFSQLGRDRTAGRTDRPGKVTKPAGVDTWTQASAGGWHSTALGSDGNLYTWGDNQYGELGRDTGSADMDATPGLVAKPAGVDTWTRAIAGGWHSVAIGSDGNLYTWGRNTSARLGRDTTTAPTDRPGKVTKPAGVDKWTQISTGNDHSLVIDSDSHLYSWGGDGQGQLGRSGGSKLDKQVIFPDEVALTSVKFGQEAATGLSANTDGTWSVTTPAHAAGTVTVTVSWTLNGVAQPDEHLTYTYEAAPVVTRTVTFDSAGGSAIPAQQVTDGEKAVRPTDPTRDGYQFDGWFNGTDAYDFDQPVTGDLTLTAHWTRNTTMRWTITPDKGPVTGGTKITFSRVSAEEDSRAIDTDGNPGQTFSPDEVALTSVKFGQEAATGLSANTDGTWSVTTPAHAAGTVTVTVSWTLNGVAQPDEHLTYTYEAAPVVTRTVTFDSAGGSAIPAQQVTDGEKAVRPTDPTRDGYQFDGWFNGTDAYDFDQPVTGDLTLTAHWTRNADPQPGDPTPGTTTDPTQKPADPAQKPADPAGDPDPSDVLSSTGSDTTAILATGLLALTAGAMALAGVRTQRRHR